ncbi:MAG: hypothetical protein WBP44_09370 [Gammaproteobacteria bacterium]|jgi:hypothetical protein
MQVDDNRDRQRKLAPTVNVDRKIAGYYYPALAQQTFHLKKAAAAAFLQHIDPG